MPGRLRQMQACWSLAEQALNSSRTYTSCSAPRAAVDVYRSAFSIAAMKLQISALSCSPFSIIYSRAVSQAAVAEQPQADIRLTQDAVERIQELSKHNKGVLLRLRVDAGGCSGFSYKFDLDSSQADEDIVVQQQGVQLVTDSVSYELLKGATVDYTTDLIRASFEVTQNPNASGKCGCGASFEPKM